MDYNLLDEDWIPVLYRNGDWRRVGIRKALEDAHRIRQIAASNPMDRVAILRFLLALLYWCRGNPPEDGSGAPSEGFPSEWFSKLDENRECFNLLGDGKRFYQDRSCRNIEPEHTTHYLLHEIPSGTNVWHFRHAIDGVDGLCPACCAAGLVRLPAFTTGGGKGMSPESGKSPGVNQKPPLYVMPVGDSLGETLRLSWYSRDNLGTPEWDTPGAKLPTLGEVSLLTGLTWLPRRIWLGGEEESEEGCVSCGRKTRLIRKCVFDGKGSQKAEGRIWRDPHVIYGVNRDGGIASLAAEDALGSNDAAAGQWVRTLSGVLSKADVVKSSPAWIVGFASIKNDKYLEAWECVLPKPAVWSARTVALLEQWRSEGRWKKPTEGLALKLKPKNEKNPRRDHSEIPAALAAIRPHVEGEVSRRIECLTEGNEDAWERAAGRYRPMMVPLGKSLSPGFTTAAVARRRKIANAVPDMRPKEAPDKKTAAKKRGKK